MPDAIRAAFNARWFLDDETGCWLWTGQIASHGYGTLWMPPAGSSPMRAHRLSWELHIGPIPAGMHVCHRCDTPPCVNPAHFWIGTQAANNQDAIAKGRAPVKLTSADVSAIRLRMTSVKALAQQFGVCETTIRKVLRGELWSRV